MNLLILFILCNNKKKRENSEKLKNLDNEFEAFKTNREGEVDLWVEKFKPKDFFELLSDDVID